MNSIGVLVMGAFALLPVLKPHSAESRDREIDEKFTGHPRVRPRPYIPQITDPPGVDHGGFVPAELVSAKMDERAKLATIDAAAAAGTLPHTVLPHYVKQEKLLAMQQRHTQPLRSHYVKW